MSNHFFRRAQKRASSLKNDNGRIVTLLKSLAEKISRVNWKNVKVEQAKDRLQVIARLVKAYVDGRYRNVPWKVIASLLAVIIYFINPFDLIPDVVPIIGLTDDVSILLWVLSTMEEEIKNFLNWERSQLPAL